MSNDEIAAMSDEDFGSELRATLGVASRGAGEVAGLVWAKEVAKPGQLVQLVCAIKLTGSKPGEGDAVDYFRANVGRGNLFNAIRKDMPDFWPWGFAEEEASKEDIDEAQAWLRDDEDMAIGFLQGVLRANDLGAE